MPINRRAVTTYYHFDPRNKPTDEERCAFEQLRSELRINLPTWDALASRNGTNATAVGEVLDVKAELRAAHHQFLDHARKFTTGTDAGKPFAEAAFKEAMLAARCVQRAIDYADKSIAMAEELRNAVPIYGGAAESSLPEVRSGADWRAARPENDNELHQAAESGQFDIADFCRAVAGMRSTEAAKRALSIGTDTAGGFSVPTVLMPGILDALAPVSSLLQAGAAIIPMDLDGQGGKSMNWAAVQTLPTAAWRNEAGSVAESDPVFRNVQAIPRSLAFRFKVSRELLADGNGLREALNRAIGAAFAKELDRAGLLGSGTAPEPRGIANVSGVQAVGNGANGASLATLRWANLMTAYQSILAADAPSPTAAIMSPRSLIGFGNLADTTNQPLQRPTTLQDVRFIATSAIPNTQTVGTSTDCTTIFVGDFTGVRFIFRERPSIQLLTELYAESGQVGFLCHVRADVIVPYPAQMAVVTGVRP